MEDRNFGILHRRLNEEEKKRFRKYEDSVKKVIDATEAIVFNENCIREKLCPKSIRRSGRAWMRWKEVEKILRQRIRESEDRIRRFEAEATARWEDFCNTTSEEIQEIARSLMQSEQRRYRQTVSTRHSKKLLILNGGPVRNEQHRDGFVNLAGIELTPQQTSFLNLGLQCHYSRKPHPEAKRIETEALIDRLLQLQNEGKVDVTHECIDELVGEAGRQRGNYSSRILTKELRDAAKELRSNQDIIVRRGDKAAVYVIMKRSEYFEKLDRILLDASKFERLEKDPTQELKKKMSRLVTKANNQQNTVKFPKIIGDYGPGYCYGTVKTHKQGNPLRPIISQMTSPTYKIAKTLNDLLVPYIPGAYSLKSATEFIDLLQNKGPEEDIASLDVESLFTNVPVEETIKIILDRVYRSEMDPLPISEEILQDMLKASTMEAPFLSHKGDLFRQVDGVAMGSPLGVLFANMYMATVEERAFREQEKPSIYCRYIDDIFITIKDANDAEKIIDIFKSNSVLNFTSEHSQAKTLPFLDVLVKQKERRFETTVFTKATNIGRCLNARGECPDNYKKSVVRAYVNRAFTHCTTWKDVHAELDRIRQLLTNNGYQDSMIETAISKKMEEFHLQTSRETPKEEDLIIYHRLDYGTAYHEECHALKGIMNRGVTPKDPYKKILLRVYSKPNLTSSLVMKNNTAPEGPKEMCTNVVYKFSCPEETCKSPSTDYLGYTTTTLRRRLLAHRNQGAIHQHFVDIHDRKPSLKELIDSTNIIHKESRYGRLLITEAVSIAIQKPSLNIQMDFNTALPSCRSRRNLLRNSRPAEHPPEDIEAIIEDNVTGLLRSLRPRPAQITVQ